MLRDSLGPFLSGTTEHWVSMRLDFPRAQDIPSVQSKSRLASSTHPGLVLIKGHIHNVLQSGRINARNVMHVPHFQPGLQQSASPKLFFRESHPELCSLVRTQSKAEVVPGCLVCS